MGDKVPQYNYGPGIGATSTAAGGQGGLSPLVILVALAARIIEAPSPKGRASLIPLEKKGTFFSGGLLRGALPPLT